ncbi:MAG: ABC transporter substrate-binding protein [Thermoprotei archaeon]|nr:MAG: ABC transporter substrate-binding protein [Thermoprotei archaeon]
MFNDILDITLRSLWISGSATIISSLWSILLAYKLSRSSGASRYVIPLFEALIGIPTVLIGLLLYMILSSRGPLGVFRLLYTPYAIILGQAILVTPLITSLCYRVFSNSWNTFGELAYTLGASEKQVMTIVLRESIPGVIAASVMGFSRAIGELGIALMVGGNIRGFTRVLTTAIALEVSKGEFETAVVLGVVLIVLVVAVSFSLRILKRMYRT